MTEIRITGERPDTDLTLALSPSTSARLTSSASPRPAISWGRSPSNCRGLTAIRIDTTTRTIAIDCISGMTTRAEPCLPEWLVHDLRSRTYGDFHRLSPAEDCFDLEGCRDADDPDSRQRIELVARSS